MKYKHSLSEEIVKGNTLLIKIHTMEHQMKALMDDKDMEDKDHLERQGDLQGQIKVLERNAIEAKSTIEDAHDIIDKKEREMVDLKGNLTHKDDELERNEDRFKQKIIDTEKSNKEWRVKSLNCAMN